MMACCSQPHIDLYSQFELNHVLAIVDGDPPDQPPDQSIVKWQIFSFRTPYYPYPA